MEDISGVVNLVTYIVNSLVDNTEAVNIRLLEGDVTSVIEIRVAEDDIGKIIGRQGRTIKSLRTLVLTASAKLKKHVSIELMEE